MKTGELYASAAFDVESLIQCPNMISRRVAYIWLRRAGILGTACETMSFGFGTTIDPLLIGKLLKL
jgi:hypothetical protein